MLMLRHSSTYAKNQGEDPFQGRLEEAKKLGEEAMSLFSKYADGHSILAHIYLEQEILQDKALALLENAVKLHKAKLFVRLGSPEEQVTMLCLKAWAYAQLHRSEEAEKALQQALAKTRPHKKPDYAKQLYFLARTALVLGKQNDARGFLEKAAAADPIGAWGQKAEKFLRTNLR